MARFSTPSTCSTRNKYKLKRVQWADEEKPKQRRASSSEVPPSARISKFIYKITSKFEPITPDCEIPKTNSKIEEEDSKDNEIEQVAPVNQKVKQASKAPEPIQLVNQRNKIVITTKHVDIEKSKDLQNIIGSSYLQNKIPVEDLQLNLSKLRQL
mmetsp:Transcript_39260/g.45017  ORF Transcript_39260/g.45017 Transcript_39260/m.45017 type:complete len:155 (-) Transcript_39260:714-1178(-)